MTVEEKLSLIEEIWADLVVDPARLHSPAWHGEVLAQRSARISDGTAKFSTLDSVAARLERLPD
jgi:hypothetical protein